MKRRPETAIALALLTMLPLSACERETPASVCAAEETIEMVHKLTSETLLGNEPDVDLARWERALDEFVSFDLITLESYDDQTGRVVCRARISSPINFSTALQVEYSRQPEAGTGEPIFRLTLLDPNLQAWDILLYRIADRYRQLERFPETNTTLEAQLHDENEEELPHRTTSSAYEHANTFQITPEGLRASVINRIDTDTTSAMVVGAVTADDALVYCSPRHDEDRALRSCIDQTMRQHSSDVVISANCRTQELLNSDGKPYRRLFIDGTERWRDDATEDLVPPASIDEMLLRYQFMWLCPVTVGGAG